MFTLRTARHISNVGIVSGYEETGVQIVVVFYYLYLYTRTIVVVRARWIFRDIAENQIERDRTGRSSDRKNRMPIARGELSPRQRTRALARDGEKRG